MQVSIWLLLLQQTLSTACLLVALGRGLGLAVRLSLRLIMAALLGGLAVTAAIACGVRWVEFFLTVPMLLLPWLAFPQGFPRAYRPLPAVTTLLLTSGVGLMRFLSALGLPGAAVMTMTGGLLIILLPALRSHGTGPIQAVVSIALDGRTVKLDGLVDSGNLLTDTVTQRPVIVLSPKAAMRLGIAPLRIRSGMRLMRARTAAGTLLLTLILPERVEIGGKTVSAMLGISPDKQAQFDALIPAMLMREQDRQAPLEQTKNEPVV